MNDSSRPRRRRRYDVNHALREAMRIARTAHPPLSSGCHRVLDVVLERTLGWSKRSEWLYVGAIAGTAGLDHRWTQRALQRLHKLGIIRWHPKPGIGKKSFLEIVTFPENMAQDATFSEEENTAQDAIFHAPCDEKGGDDEDEKVAKSEPKRWRGTPPLSLERTDTRQDRHSSSVPEEAALSQKSVATVRREPNPFSVDRLDRDWDWREQLKEWSRLAARDEL